MRSYKQDPDLIGFVFVRRDTSMHFPVRMCVCMCVLVCVRLRVGVCAQNKAHVSVKTAICEPGRELLPENKLASTLTYDFQHLELQADTLLSFRSPSTWYFVMAA